MTTDTRWQEQRALALAETISELEEIGNRRVRPHGDEMRQWREDRDEAIRAAMYVWSRADLPVSQIAELVGCTTQRVRQIGDES